jgi:hypothetical protein
MLRTRLARVTATCALAVGCLAPLSLIGATQADAATRQCIDWAAADPTPVHIGPYDSSDTIEYKDPGDQVTGTCWWINNTSEGRWYMQVYMAGGGYGYIWVQRLVHGQDHVCIVDGVDAEKIWYGNYCGLIDITPGY